MKEKGEEALGGKKNKKCFFNFLRVLFLCKTNKMKSLKKLKIYKADSKKVLKYGIFSVIIYGLDMR